MATAAQNTTNSVATPTLNGPTCDSHLWHIFLVGIRGTHCELLPGTAVKLICRPLLLLIPESRMDLHTLDLTFHVHRIWSLPCSEISLRIHALLSWTLTVFFSCQPNSSAGFVLPESVLNNSDLVHSLDYNFQPQMYYFANFIPTQLWYALFAIQSFKRHHLDAGLVAVIVRELCQV